MSRILIVNADDFGFSDSVNKGIVEAHAKGVLTATTWLAGGEAAEEAAALAQEHPRLEVGLHLALNDTTPCALAEQVAPLLDGSKFPSRYPATIRRLLTSAAARRAAVAEWTAQYHRFHATFGRAPLHVDSHQHVALLPPLWQPFLQLARERGVRFVRVPAEVERFGDLRGPRLPAALLLSGLARRFGVQARRAGLGIVDHFLGFRFSGGMTETRVLNLVSTLRPGVTELMVHPGASATADGYARRAELEALTSPVLRETLVQSEVRLARFCDLS
jgi:predicted glycoside hydrolase/deacetylase ChbG (UPF0249 family)